MLDILSHAFAAVCGQNPGHTWAPGGILLPCCQRCTGLYVGAGVAALLHLWLRPKLSGRFLEIHGAFLLAMAPFGLHWVSQGPFLRTATGALFGVGVVTFLWLPLGNGSARKQRTSNIQHPTSNIQWPDGGHSLGVGCSMLHVGCFRISSTWAYFVVLGITLLVLPLAAGADGPIAAYVLSALIVWGALALLTLVLSLVSLGFLGILRWARRPIAPSESA
jgi:uncharacterized membrane protein